MGMYAWWAVASHAFFFSSSGCRSDFPPFRSLVRPLPHRGSRLAAGQVVSNLLLSL